MKLLEELLKEMCERKASDLLLTVGAPPQLRINGMLVSANHPPMEGSVIERMAFNVLGERRMEVLIARKSVDFSKGYEGLSRFRFNFYYQRDSIAAAIRVIPFKIPPFEELGLPDAIKEFALRPHGLVLITGSAGSGKSTTLAAMLDYINDNRRLHVVCLEDPIEYLHHHKLSVIDQREIGEDANSFTEALHSVFRQSPDVIMVGEMRDLETIQLVLSLAETGHLIMGTLHTQDTTHAINRIVDVFPPAQQQQIYTQLSMVLLGIVSQQLLVNREATRRVLACEVMNVNQAIRNLIREMQVQQLYSAIQTGRSEGMITMNDSLKSLYERGLIDAGTAMSRSPRPKELARFLTLKG
ncbi:MAG: PilT/PilU family type 4a pilus ATPase [bacterium]|jgi:twitching motility protein PilT